MSKSLHDQWTALATKRSSITQRWEDYARWTLPWVYPESGTTENDELSVARGSIGARSVNHLANKIVQTLFLPYRPFFRLTISRETIENLQTMGDAPYQEMLATIDLRLAQAEQEAHAELNIAVHRTQAVLAAKYLIILGNALLYYPEDDIGNVEVYSPKDYCVKRDLSGKVIQIITRDTKRFDTFSEDVQNTLRSKKGDKAYDADTDVHLYTSIDWKAKDKKYHVTQAADNTPLDTKGSYPAKKLPWITLTWNMVRGEDYGRGLVEDYAYAFHSHQVLTESCDTLVGVLAHIIGLVKPGGYTDVEDYNNSKSGQYIPGEEGDVTYPDTGKRFDLAAVQARIQELEREIAQAFLLNSAVTRDAERVTKEEIIRQAQELEVSHGGIYSRLAAEWQTQLARLLLDGIDFDIGEDFVPTIITGMDTLSRTGELENIELWFQDMGAMGQIPEPFLQEFHLQRTMAILATQRNVPYEKMLKTVEEKQAEQEQAEAAEQRAMEAQSNAQANAEAAKVAAQQM